MVIGVSFYFVTRSTGGSGTFLDGQPVRAGQFNLGIPYGAASKRVLRELGAPDEKDGSCWLYRGRVGKIRGRYSGWHVDAMKFCFAPAGPGRGETVAQIFSHYVAYKFKKQNVPPRWAVPLTFGGVPKSEQQGGS